VAVDRGNLDVSGAHGPDEGVYNATPAHMDDIHAAIIEALILKLLRNQAVSDERRTPSSLAILFVSKSKRAFSQCF
jgi:hypothetical protein